MINILKKFKEKKWRKNILVFCLIFLFSLIFIVPAFAAGPNPPQAAGPDDTASLTYRIFAGIFAGIIGLEGWLLVMLTRVFLAIAKYNGFVSSPAVLTGWTLVRDVANMFFILIMLAIALGTILHIESYNFKRLLPKVLIMAVLVNFSRTLCGLAIDFAQVAMMTFAVGFASIAGAGDLMATLHITEMLNASVENLKNPKAIEYFSAFVTGLLAVILLLVAVITVLVMLVVIVMRMIMLWLLVVLSPLPFVLSAFPAGQKYAQQWTQEFFKYVIVGPVLAFFLWLSLAVSSTGKLENMVADETVTSELTTLSKGEDSVPVADDAATAAVFTGIGTPDNFLAFLIGIGMLMGGLMITQQLGVAGGAFAGQMSSAIRQKGLSAVLAPAKLGKWGAGKAWTGTKVAAKSPFQWVGRKVNEGISEGRISALWNPAGMIRGWQARRKDLYESSEQAATAGAQEWLEKKFTKTSMPRRSMLAHAEESKFAKEFSFMNKNEMAKTAIDLMQAPDTAEIRSKRRALIRAAGEQGYIDDIMGTDEMISYVRNSFNDAYNGEGQFKNDSDDIKKARRAYFDESGIKQRVDAGEWHGFDQVHMFLESFVGRDRNGAINEDGLNTIDSLEEIGMRIGHAEYAGHASYDASKGSMVMTTLQQGNFNAHSKAETEFNKLKGRNRIPTAPHALFNFNNDEKGNFFASLDRYTLSNMIMAFKGQGKNIAEHGQNRNLSVLFGGEMSGMKWSKDDDGKIETREVKDATGKTIGETKVVDLTRLSGEALQKQLRTMAAFMSIAGQDGVSAAWKKVGGDGETAQFKIVGDDGKPKYIDHKTLMEMHPINDTLTELAGKGSDLAQEGVPEQANQAGTEPAPEEMMSPEEFKRQRASNAGGKLNKYKLSDKEELAKRARKKTGKKAKAANEPFIDEFAYQDYQEKYRAYHAKKANETAQAQAKQFSEAQTPQQLQQAIEQSPANIQQIVNSIESAIKSGLDAQGIIQAVNSLGDIFNQLGHKALDLKPEIDMSKINQALLSAKNVAAGGQPIGGGQGDLAFYLRQIKHEISRMANKEPDNNPNIG